MGHRARLWILCLSLLTQLLLARVAWAGQNIQVPTPYSTYANAYVAGPETAPAAVLIVPDIWGLSPQVMDWVDRIGGLGIRAMAIDFYDGRMVSDSAMAAEVYGTIDKVWIEQDLRGGLNHLSGRHDRLALMGWGKGGRHAIHLLESGAVGADKVRVVAIYSDDASSSTDLIPGLDLPVLDVSTSHSLVDPFSPVATKDIESTWAATRDFLEQRLR